MTNEEQNDPLARISHTEIGRMIDDLTDQKNPNQHNREVLDDIISDLIQYRSTLPSMEWYEKNVFPNSKQGKNYLLKRVREGEV